MQQYWNEFRLYVGQMRDFSPYDWFRYTIWGGTCLRALSCHRSIYALGSLPRHPLARICVDDSLGVLDYLRWQSPLMISVTGRRTKPNLRWAKLMFIR